MGRPISIAGILILLIVVLPLATLIFLLWSVPFPPDFPDWQSDYERFVAADEDQKASRLLEAAILSGDPRALTLCRSDHTPRPCRDFAGTKEELDHFIGQALDTETLRSAAKKARFIDAVVLGLSLNDRIRARWPAGVRFALADGWLYAQCVSLLTRAPALPELLARTLAEVNGRTYRESAYRRFEASCKRRERDFAQRLKDGDYGTAAITYASDWP